MSRDKGGEAKPGPKPETLHIDGDWQDAVARALKRGKPPKAWARARQRISEPSKH
jgi:hypothetical protein